MLQQFVFSSIFGPNSNMRLYMVQLSGLMASLTLLPAVDILYLHTSLNVCILISIVFLHLNDITVIWMNFDLLEGTG